MILPATGLLLFVLALYGVFTRKHLLRKVIAVNIAGSGVFLFVVGAAPSGIDGTAGPVPQAMVLTGIIIAVSITAYAVSLLRRFLDETGRTSLEEDD